MPKWPPGATEFKVSVIPNVRCQTNYSYIPKPVLERLGNPQKLKFLFDGANNVIVRASD